MSSTPAPAGHTAVWNQYLRASGTDPAGWTLKAGGLKPAHFEALRLNLLDNRGATGWAIATDRDGLNIRVALIFNTSGDALKVLDLSPEVERHGALVAFDNPTKLFQSNAEGLAAALIDQALTRLSVAVAQVGSYQALHDNETPDLITLGWAPLTEGDKPLLSEAPTNPLNGQTHVGHTAGPDVGWVQNASGLRLSVPQMWNDAFPELSDISASFY
ncbi:MAG: hypothetical protein V3V20_12470 [Algisphaera sp.]